jgi:class 3 adenylate cyclase
MKINGKIRYKILVVVIPILIVTSVFIGMTAYYSSKNGITSIAKEFLGYKLNDIYKFTARQYAMIQSMGNEGAGLLDSTKVSVAQYAKTVINSETGGFVAFSVTNGLDFTTFETNQFSEAESSALKTAIGEKSSGWLEFSAGSKSFIGVFILFSDWNDYFIIIDDRETFYSNVNEIVRYLVIILGASIAIATIILLVYINRITAPINDFVKTIQSITAEMNLTKRVKIYYKDEIGVLGNYFNNMNLGAGSGLNQIKNYAYQTVLAKKKEERVRYIFQKYVPQEIVNQVLNISSESMLIGNRQQVSILFSDIRGFTTISESMQPEELVLSLNAYFNEMVSIIMANHGVIDKFIGDAIMADFGVPMTRAEDAENAVMSALLMIEALARFNKGQDEKGKVNFNIGVGINTGDAIVGNIGSEQKIEYTVIGDTVNLASRLEGLTKKYHSPIVISQFTRDTIKSSKFYYRELDNVRVKGKNEPVKIYLPMYYDEGVKNKDYYDEYHKNLNLYYKGDFKKAVVGFKKLKEQKPQDEICDLYIERCEYLIANPPDEWDGVETWTTK